MATHGGKRRDGGECACTVRSAEERVTVVRGAPSSCPSSLCLLLFAVPCAVFLLTVPVDLLKFHVQCAGPSPALMSAAMAPLGCVYGHDTTGEEEEEAAGVDMTDNREEEEGGARRTNNGRQSGTANEKRRPNNSATGKHRSRGQPKNDSKRYSQEKTNTEVKGEKVSQQTRYRLEAKVRRRNLQGRYHHEGTDNRGGNKRIRGYSLECTVCARSHVVRRYHS